MRWEGHEARMEEGRSALKILTGKRTGICHWTSGFLKIVHGNFKQHSLQRQYFGVMEVRQFINTDYDKSDYKK